MMKHKYLLILLGLAVGLIPATAPVARAQNLQSATDSVIVSFTNDPYNWGRGFRFTANANMWVIKIGKRVPQNGTYSWSIWNYTTQTKVFGQNSQVDDPGNWVYEDCDSIIELHAGQQYILELYGMNNSWYYYGYSTQVGQDLTYHDMRYCNSCNDNTFPTVVLNNYQYGTPDFLYSLYPPICNDTPDAGNTIAAETHVLCNDSTLLSVNISSFSNGIVFQWQYNNSGSWINFGADTNSLYSPAINATTQYRCIVTCTNSGGVDTSAPVTVTTGLDVNISPQDTTLCSGINLPLDAGFSGSNYNYIWNNGSTSEINTVSQPGTYLVIVTTPLGCSGSDTVNITQAIEPVNNLPATKDLCDGDSLTLNAGNPGFTYSWNTGQTTQSIVVDTGGTYSVTVTSSDGCILQSSTQVTSRPLPVVNLGNDTVICSAKHITLNAHNVGCAYLWNTGATTQTITTGDSGIYSVVVTTPYGCSASDAMYLGFRASPHVNGFYFVPQFYENIGQVQFFPIDPYYVDSYLWDFGDGTIPSGDTTPIHYFPPGDQQYHITLTVSNGCGDYSNAQTIEVNTETGVVRVVGPSNELTVYPNPAKEALNVTSKNGIALKQAVIYDVNGRVVGRLNQSAHPTSKLQISTAKLSNGLYLLRVETKNGWQNKRFEVMK